MIRLWQIMKAKVHRFKVHMGWHGLAEWVAFLHIYGNGNSRNVSCSKPSLRCPKRPWEGALYKWLTRSASDTMQMAHYVNELHITSPNIYKTTCYRNDYYKELLNKIMEELSCNSYFVFIFLQFI